MITRRSTRRWFLNVDVDLYFQYFSLQDTQRSNTDCNSLANKASKFDELFIEKKKIPPLKNENCEQREGSRTVCSFWKFSDILWIIDLDCRFKGN